MKTHHMMICFALALALMVGQTAAQNGRIETIEIHSSALQNNLLGDPATRSAKIYLPPSYDSSHWHYPVVFVLHGGGIGPSYFGTTSWRYHAMMSGGSAPESIVVFPDGDNRIGGSFYLNSEVVGDYGAHITRDLLNYIDENYRTIPHPQSRGIYGHSMGGWGSMHLALTYPDRLGAVFADAGLYDLGYVEMRRIVAESLPNTLGADWSTFSNETIFSDDRRSILAFLAGFIPNSDNPPFFVDMSFVEVDGQIQEPNPGDWDRDWDRVVEHDIIHEVDRYLAGEERLHFIGFTHGALDWGGGFTPVEQARILDRKLTAVGLQHTYIEHPGRHAPELNEVLPLLMAQLRTVPPELPDIDQSSPAVLIALADQARILSDLRLSFAAPLQQAVRLHMDASALGGRADIALQRTSDTEYAGDGSITPMHNGRFFLPVTLETADDNAYVAHRLQVDVFPAQDVVLFGEDIAPAWTLEVNRRVESAPGVHDNRPSLALSTTSGSWWIAFGTTTPVDLFGYEALSFAFHPGNHTLPTERDLRLQVGIVNLLEKVDLNLSQWQTITISTEELGLRANLPLENIRFAGNLEGTFYLGDIRLVAQQPPNAPEATAVLESYDSATPANVSLQQNFPNPFNSSTVIRFALAQTQHVDLKIYNLAGQQVAKLVEGVRSPGQYALTWDGRDASGRALASGLYLYQLKAGDRVETRKLLMLR